VPRVSAAAPEHRGWRRVAEGVGRRPRGIWIGTALALVVLTLGIGKLHIGMPGDEYFRDPVGSITGQHLLEKHYPGGTSDPADIIARPAAADAVVAAAKATPGVAAVSAAEPSADGRWVRIAATLTDQAESNGAVDTVERLRTAVHAVPAADAVVGGVSANVADTRTAANRDDLVVMPLILAVVFIILVLLLRALVAPLVLLASVVLSYAAAMGASGLVLSAIGHPRLWEAIPLQTFLFLVALGVDYTIFLMTRAREEVVVHGHRRGVLQALAVTGGVITSAGVVLAATFAALNLMPLVPSMQTGIIIAVGVLIDTVLVRTLLVPALALDLGAKTWWPGRLARRPEPAPAEHPDAVPVGSR
jgi:RND superfamily putative drug exporter